jgi:MGT family glycosyltransferase
LIEQLGQRVRDNWEQRLIDELTLPIQKRYLESLIRGETLDELMRELKPDVVLMCCYFYFAAMLVRYRYNVPLILLNASAMPIDRARASKTVVDTLISIPGATTLVDSLLSAKIKIKNFADIAGLFLRLPELMLSPVIYELPSVDRNPCVFYAGHEIDLERAERPYDWSRLRSDRPLVYFSLGSRPDLVGETSRRLIRITIDAAAQRPDWQFVISLGAKLNADEFGSVPSHVTLSHWVPQLQMLARTSAMITHAGMGTVKECILHGVPMLALPIMHDQFASADRIVHHGLGIRGNFMEIGSEELSSGLGRVIEDQSFKQRAMMMSEEFQRAEALNLGIELVEGAIAGRLPSNS